MNKKDLVSALAVATETTQKEAETLLNAFMEVVTTELHDGGRVDLIGFGSFFTKERAERKGRNPQTGAEITIAAATTPAFKAGKNLKEATNKGNK